MNQKDFNDLAASMEKQCGDWKHGKGFSPQARAELLAKVDGLEGKQAKVFRMKKRYAAAVAAALVLLLGTGAAGGRAWIAGSSDLQRVSEVTTKVNNEEKDSILLEEEAIHQEIAEKLGIVPLWLGELPEGMVLDSYTVMEETGWAVVNYVYQEKVISIQMFRENIESSSNVQWDGTAYQLENVINDCGYEENIEAFCIDEEHQNYGANIIGGRQLGRYINAYLSYQIERSEIEGLDAFYRDAGYQNGVNIKSALTPSISFNNTDDYYVPRSGIIASTSLEYAGLGGDMEFIKNRTTFNIYQGLQDYIDMDLILRYKSGFGYIYNDDSSKLPINEKLFLGGISSIRGYDSRSVTPKKKICNPKNNNGTVVNGCEIIETGGKISFNNSFELSFPIINRLKMRGVIFYDYGMIGHSDINEIKRSSTGAGIEWITPIGPLQLFYAQAIDDKKGDDTSSFEFTIGRRF